MRSEDTYTYSTPGLESSRVSTSIVDDALQPSPSWSRTHEDLVVWHYHSPFPSPNLPSLPDFHFMDTLGPCCHYLTLVDISDTVRVFSRHYPFGYWNGPSWDGLCLKTP